MAPLWAEETLREHSSELSGESIRRLTLLATGSEEQAQDALTAYVERELRAGRSGA